jgi:hypothetical protein
MKLEKAGKPTDYGTSMQCFCKYEKKHNPLKYDGDYIGSINVEPHKICAYYFSDIYVSKAMGLSIAIFIVVINLILQMIIIKCVDWIGEDTNS